MDLSSGNWLIVGPSMGSWSSILSFGLSCRSSVIMLILVLIRSFLDYQFVRRFRCSVILLPDDTESKRSVMSFVCSKREQTNNT